MSKLILSDLHLGHPSCKRIRLREILVNHYLYNQIILNGDIIDLYYQDKLNSADLEIIELLKEINDRLIWIKGNHDIYLSSKNKKLLPKLKFQSFYEWKSGFEKFHIRHGHDFGLLNNISKYYHKTSTKNTAINFALENKITTIIIGHTHCPSESEVLDVRVINLGSFIDHYGTYCEIKNSEIKINNILDSNKQLILTN